MQASPRRRVHNHREFIRVYRCMIRRISDIVSRRRNHAHGRYAYRPIQFPIFQVALPSPIARHGGGVDRHRRRMPRLRASAVQRSRCDSADRRSSSQQLERGDEAGSGTEPRDSRRHRRSPCDHRSIRAAASERERTSLFSPTRPVHGIVPRPPNDRSRVRDGSQRGWTIAGTHELAKPSDASRKCALGGHGDEGSRAPDRWPLNVYNGWVTACPLSEHQARAFSV